MSERAIYRALFDLSPSAIALEDEHGTILDANPALCRIMGYTREDLIGANIRTLVPPEALPDVEANLAKILAGDVLFHVVTNVRKDGGRVSLELHERLVTLPEGTRCVLVIANDVTERVKAEQALHRIEQQMFLAQKMDSLGLMAAGVAHDFNNMLLAILGNIELALADLPDHAPARENLTDATEAGRRAAGLCQQLLAYTGKGHFVVAPISINDLLRDFDPMIRASVSRKIGVSYELGFDLPTVDADATQLHQVILNLVINASEAMGDRSGTITLATAARALDGTTVAAGWLPAPPGPGRYAELAVVDNGCGIAPDILPRIFEPFYSSKFIGRGLGLPAALGIVHGHRGAIRAVSATGTGSRFEILLPASTRAAIDVEPPEPPADAWRPRATVLVVDDEEQVRLLTQRMLEHLGCRVVLAASGEEALRLAREPSAVHDCVLLDLTMPSKDGIETLAELRALRPDAVVVLMSGYAEADVLERLRGARHSAFLQKPFNLQRLKSTLQRVLPR